MSNQESIGIASIALGLLIVVGVVRGTWKKVFQDLGFSGPGVQANTGLTPTSTSGSSQPTTTPLSYVSAFQGQTDVVGSDTTLGPSGQVIGGGSQYVYQ